MLPAPSVAVAVKVTLVAVWGNTTETVTEEPPDLLPEIAPDHDSVVDWMPEASEAEAVKVPDDPHETQLGPLMLTDGGVTSGGWVVVVGGGGGGGGAGGGGGGGAGGAVVAGAVVTGADPSPPPPRGTDEVVVEPGSTTWADTGG